MTRLSLLLAFLPIFSLAPYLQMQVFLLFLSIGEVVCHHPLYNTPVKHLSSGHSEPSLCTSSSAPKKIIKIIKIYSCISYNLHQKLGIYSIKDKINKVN